VFGAFFLGSSEPCYHLDREHHDYYDQQERGGQESEDDVHQGLHAALLLRGRTSERGPWLFDPRGTAYPHAVCRTIQVSLMQRFPAKNLALVNLLTERGVMVSRQETPDQRNAACSMPVG
jgi:hypothetical protein